MVEDFRRVEKFWMGLARHSPDQVHLFMYDDTSAFPLPHFGNREPKSCAGKSRILMVPWLVDDVGRGTRTYVYSFKGATIKGANRWSPGECSFLFCLQPPWCRCTNMFNVIRAAKTGPKRLARTCILLADNYSENKNNHVLAFCSELVLHGSYCKAFVLVSCCAPQVVRRGPDGVWPSRPHPYGNRCYTSTTQLGLIYFMIDATDQIASYNRVWIG